MADVLKDLTAAFQATAVWAAAKINNTARVDSDSNVWVTANWANAVDDQLKLINSFCDYFGFNFHLAKIYLFQDKVDAYKKELISKLSISEVI